MCQACDRIIDATPSTGRGATADAWAKADAAINAWRDTLPPETEFEDVLEECDAWCRHMDDTMPSRNKTGE